MKNIEIGDFKYELVDNYRDAFVFEDFNNKFTDYFYEFDYIVGDWAYGKLRLKGFFNNKNDKCKDYNNIDNVKKYLKENCAYNCKYFILKKYIQN